MVSGRTIRTETEGFADGQTLIEVAGFNALGQQTFVSAPKFDGASNAGTRYTGYDLLGRLTEKIVDQTGGQSMAVSYTHETGAVHGFTTDINADGMLLSRTYNGLAQLTETVDAMGGTTRYAYDGGGNPIVMQDPNGKQYQRAPQCPGAKTVGGGPEYGAQGFHLYRFWRHRIGDRRCESAD